MPKFIRPRHLIWFFDHDRLVYDTTLSLDCPHRDAMACDGTTVSLGPTVHHSGDASFHGHGVGGIMRCFIALMPKHGLCSSGAWSKHYRLCFRSKAGHLATMGVRLKIVWGLVLRRIGVVMAMLPLLLRVDVPRCRLTPALDDVGVVVTPSRGFSAPLN